MALFQGGVILDGEGTKLEWMGLYGEGLERRSGDLIGEPLYTVEV